MATNEKNNNLMENLMDAQTSFVNHTVEATKKLTENVPFVQETLDKGQKLFNDAVSSQKEMAHKAAQTFEKTTNEMKQNSENTQNFFQKWFENQTNWAKTTFNQTNPAENGFSTNPADWMKQMQNMMNPTQNPYMQMWQNNPFMNANQANPFSAWTQNNPFMQMNDMQSNINDGLNQWSNVTKQYFDYIQSTYSGFPKQFENITSAEAFKGMMDLNNNVSKFFDVWMPMFKSMQENTFTPEMFHSLLNADKFKSFMDSFFKFMPEENQKMMEQMNAQFIQYMKQASESGLNNYTQFQNQIQGMQQNPYANMWSMYTNWKQAVDNAVSPLSKLVNGNANVEQAMAWNTIADRMVEFNIKNNELQYMIYQHGLKAFEQVSVKIADKIKQGESIDSVIKLYQEWLMSGDEVFTSLFNSDAYSKLMTDVSSLQMKLKQDVDTQVEKTMLVNIPVATRSEMDEVYKNIYDLKKMYRNLEKMFANGVTEKTEAPVKTATQPVTKIAAQPAAKTTKKK